jgi:hypothetical protein
MNQVNRREFLLASGMAVASSNLRSGVSPVDVFEASPQISKFVASSVASVPGGLCNTDIRSIIGLGDESPTIIDKYGQLLRSRNAATRLRFGPSLETAERAHGSQSLLNGYLPVIETSLDNAGGSLTWSAFASNHGGVKADYIQVTNANVPFQVMLSFPFTTSIRVENQVVLDGDSVLALFAVPKAFSVKQAKYNLLTQQTMRSGTEFPDPKLVVSNVDQAFRASRGAFLHRWIEYRFPVTAGESYHVFLGLVPQQARPGMRIFRLSVNEQTQWLDYSRFPAGEPLVLDFQVTSATNELHVKSAADPSIVDPYPWCHLSGIWIFTEPVNKLEVIKGALSNRALFYVRCGQENGEEMASSVQLDYYPDSKSATRDIRLPYDLSVAKADTLATISVASARSAEEARWQSLLEDGAELKTGITRLDNLYRTSLINLLLLRTRLPRRGQNGEDIYVVKPGADLYDIFWTRDGSYISSAFEIGGLPDEGEKSLRLFWHSSLSGTLAAWGQQTAGDWAAPVTEWDGQGQALWALVNHYEFTRDLEWLKKVYSSILRGALWIKHAIEQTKFVSQNGEKPIYYGLLPIGEGEAIAYGYNYYHCFWAALGLKQTMKAAQALNKTDDLNWIKKLHDEFSSNLLASLRLAYQRVGDGKFIPATPFDPTAPIWGSLAALYPARFLEPHDAMMTGTLEVLDSQAQEDTYTYEHDHLWTYITVEAAMCHLLRDELPMFYRLYNGYVSHASPTNSWVEGISLTDRKGSGDMPHGWGAAEYMFMHRNALLFENEGRLEFCWGVHPDWLHDDAQLTAKRAPTKFGRVDFELQRSGSKLLLDYNLRSAEHDSPNEVRLHIPKLEEALTSVRINGREHPVFPGDRVILIDKD